MAQRRVDVVERRVFTCPARCGPGGVEETPRPQLARGREPRRPLEAGRGDSERSAITRPDCDALQTGRDLLVGMHRSAGAMPGARVAVRHAGQGGMRGAPVRARRRIGADRSGQRMGEAQTPRLLPEQPGRLGRPAGGTVDTKLLACGGNRLVLVLAGQGRHEQGPAGSDWERGDSAQERPFDRRRESTLDHRLSTPLGAGEVTGQLAQREWIPGRGVDHRFGDGGRARPSIAD